MWKSNRFVFIIPTFNIRKISRVTTPAFEPNIQPRFSFCWNLCRLVEQNHDKSNVHNSINVKRSSQNSTVSVEKGENPWNVCVFDMSIPVYVQMVEKNHSLQWRSQVAIHPVQQKLVTGHWLVVWNGHKEGLIKNFKIYAFRAVP